MYLLRVFEQTKLSKDYIFYMTQSFGAKLFIPFKLSV